MSHKLIRDVMHRGVITCWADESAIDIARRLHEYGINDEIMTPNVVTIIGDIPLDVATQMMLDKRIHRLLIVQGGRTPNRPVGVLSLSDVVREMANTPEE
jgi:CBS domain-containing protein